MPNNCRHGVPRRGRYIWNEACPQCRELHDAYERSARRIGGQRTRYHQETWLSGSDMAIARWAAGLSPESAWWRFMERIIAGRRRQAARQREARAAREALERLDAESRRLEIEEAQQVRAEWLGGFLGQWAGKFTPAQLEA